MRMEHGTGVLPMNEWYISLDEELKPFLGRHSACRPYNSLNDDDDADEPLPSFFSFCVFCF